MITTHLALGHCSAFYCYEINPDNAPIIIADAFQIYQDMNIGTAKISKDDPYYKRHYLLDIKKPSESFSVMEYQSLFHFYWYTS